jgi:F-type H+-transporting ATPase subunit b
MNASVFLLSLVSHSSGGGGAIDLDLDLTVFVQVAIFIVMLLVLKPLLFDPMLKLFEQREEQIEGARAKSLKLDRESADAQSRYDAAMQKARIAAGAERDKLRAEGVKQENEILAKARAEAASVMDAGRAKVNAERHTASEALKMGSKELGRELAARVLGREIA